MSANGSPRRRSGSSSAFGVSNISQMRPRLRSDAWQEDYQHFLKFARHDGEREATTHTDSSIAETYSKLSDGSDVGQRTLTSLNTSIIYPSAPRFESAKQQNEDPPVNLARATISRSWVWEISALCFSYVCMSAIIAVLAFEDGKQVDQWGM